MATSYRSLMAERLAGRKPREVNMTREETLEDILSQRRDPQTADPFPNTTDTLDLVNAMGGGAPSNRGTSVGDLSRMKSGSSNLQFGNSSPGQGWTNGVFDDSNMNASDAKTYYDTYQQFSGGPSSTDQMFGGNDGGNWLSNLFGGGAGANTGGPSAAWNAGDFGAFGVPAEGSTSLGGLGAGAGLGGTAQGAWGAGNFGAFAVPEAGATSLGGGAGAAGGGSIMGALGPLGVLAAAAYMGYQQGEADQDRWAQEFANDPNAQAGKKFAEEHPEAFTNEGVPQGVEIGDIPFYSSMVWNPTSRRFEMKNEPGMSTADFNARDERRRQKESGD